MDSAAGLENLSLSLSRFFSFLLSSVDAHQTQFDFGMRGMNKKSNGFYFICHDKQKSHVCLLTLLSD